MIYIVAEWFGAKVGRFVLWCRWIPIVMTCRHIIKRDVFSECEINTYGAKTLLNGYVVRHRECSIDDCPKLHRQRGGDTE